ncbi:hypothetical protein [Bifidobacterium asteroides]|uniref:Uncharacterized protein n=1 Tax=Bifidobacterium asteroides TaxID=1684 RepID=A0A6N7TXV4_9BIFI|nr:hypothetical protein [Bifidobacterium asteroides]MSD91695.1 hypothetical protein [Bifidobacterium asteroides]
MFRALVPAQIFDFAHVLATEFCRIRASCAEFGVISTITLDFTHFNARSPSLEFGLIVACLDVISVCAGWCTWGVLIDGDFVITGGSDAWVVTFGGL